MGASASGVGGGHEVVQTIRRARLVQIRDALACIRGQGEPRSPQSCLQSCIPESHGISLELNTLSFLHRALPIVELAGIGHTMPLLVRMGKHVRRCLSHIAMPRNGLPPLAGWTRRARFRRCFASRQGHSNHPTASVLRTRATASQVHNAERVVRAAWLRSYDGDRRSSKRSDGNVREGPHPRPPSSVLRGR